MHSVPQFWAPQRKCCKAHHPCPHHLCCKTLLVFLQRNFPQLPTFICWNVRFKVDDLKPLQKHRSQNWNLEIQKDEDEGCDCLLNLSLLKISLQKTAKQQDSNIQQYGTIGNYRPSSILDLINRQKTHAGLQRLLWPRYWACRWGHWWSSQCNSGYIMVNVCKALWVWDQVCCHRSHWNAPKVTLSIDQ